MIYKNVANMQNILVVLKIECKFNLEFLLLYLEMKYEKKNDTKIHLFLKQFHFTKHNLQPNK